MRTAFVGLTAAVMFVASPSAAQHTLKAGEKLTSLPCDAFKKNSDGSWTQVASATYPGNIVVSGNTFKGTTEAKELDSKCGAK